MKSFKMVVLAALVVVTILSAIPAGAVSVSEENYDMGILASNLTWIQEVQADGTGRLNFTIHTIDWDGVPQPETIIAEIFINGELVATEEVWYTDEGEQDITFSWGNLVTLQNGDWYEFHLTGTDAYPNHAVKMARYNAYPEGDFWATLHPKEAFSGSADLIFDNHIIPMDETTPMVCEEVVEVVEKIVEVIKYVDRPIEVIKEVVVYVDRPVEKIVEVEVIKYIENPNSSKFMICERHGKRNINHPNHSIKKAKK